MITLGDIINDKTVMNAINILQRKQYTILLEDTGNTFNINMHTFDCFAVSEEEAIGKMVRQRPEFRNREIISIKTV